MGISFQELILLLMIGLIVLGPERLPRVANQLGRWLGQARRMTRVMKRQLEEELNLDRQFDMLPPARTRHSTPGTYAPPTEAGASTAATATPAAAPAATPAAAPAASDDEEKDDTYSPAHGKDEVGTGVGDRIDDEPEDLPDDAAGRTGDDADAGEQTDSDAAAAGAAKPADDKADSKKS